MDLTEERPVLLTVLDVCHLANMSRTAVYKEIATGQLPIQKKGRSTRIHRRDFDAWAAGEEPRQPMKAVRRRA